MPRTLDVATSFLASGARFALGMKVTHRARRPERLLELYEFEACPFCRKVREALSAFDLEAKVFPCPPGGTRYRPTVVERGGKAQFPYLVDPNAGVAMYESDAIIRHLATTYGDGSVPALLRLGPLTALTSSFASMWRLGHGRAARPSKLPAQALELYSYEASPYSRIAREALCELEIPYVLHNVAQGSQGRRAFAERSGKMQVPWLHDPNTGTSMFESADIAAYLRQTYAA